jgi:predicted ferric reductase
MKFISTFKNLITRKNFNLALFVITLVLLGSLLPEELSIQRWIAAFFAANALVSMAFTFVLATRHQALESIFGGLDQMYVIHRWSGIWSVFSILMHWWLVPQSDTESTGFNIAEFGSDTGEWATWLLVFLIAISFLKLLPYHWWKWTHKLMGVVFIITVLHFVFAVKPFSIFSPAGIAMSITSIIGIAAWWYYLKGKNKSKHYLAKVKHLTRHDNIISFDAKPLQGYPQWQAGQFAFISIPNHSEIPSEPHPYTIASHNTQGIPRFAIAALGDYTKLLNQHLQEGDKVEINMPYGKFQLKQNTKHQIWIGAGVGITPFLAWLQQLTQKPASELNATLYYLVRDSQSAVFAEELALLCSQLPKINLQVIYSSQQRLTAEKIKEDISDLSNTELYFCGSAKVRGSMQVGLESLGMPKNSIHYELFDFRNAFL